MLEPLEEGKTKKTPVVIDFQPPQGEKMYLEEKRKFFNEKGIIYVPVFLNEMLTEEQFAKRFEESRLILINGYREALEDESLKDTEIPFITDETVLAEIDARVLVQAKELGLRGAAKLKWIANRKEQLVKEKLSGMADSRRRSSPSPAYR
jgi:hypothetical protein